MNLKGDEGDIAEHLGAHVVQMRHRRGRATLAPFCECALEDVADRGLSLYACRLIGRVRKEERRVLGEVRDDRVGVEVRKTANHSIDDGQYLGLVIAKRSARGEEYSSATA